MFNEAHISLNGYVATQPYKSETRTGIPKVTMRVAWTPRHQDRVTGEWKDAGTSFVSVHCYRKLAENIATCVRKGDPVIVQGRLSVRDFEDKNGARRNAVEVAASSIGHDLNRGVATFQRVRPQTGMTALEYEAVEGGGQRDEGADEEAFASLAAAAERDRGDDGTGVSGSADDAGQPDGDMFDEAAVGALAEEVASAAAPF